VRALAMLLSPWVLAVAATAAPDLPDVAETVSWEAGAAWSPARTGAPEPRFGFALGPSSSSSDVGLAWASPAPFRPPDPHPARPLGRVAPVDRVALDATLAGAGSAPSFEDLPGGIVLGLTAEPVGDWRGATLEVDGTALALVAADGTRYELPPTPVETLLACLTFAASWDASDVVVDITPFRVDVAAPFAGTPLARVVEQADRTPLALLPTDPRIGKSLILDRRVSFEADPAQPGRLRLSADLELRLYEPGYVWRGERSAHLADCYPIERGPDGVLRFTRAPAGAPPGELARRLEPLSDLAGLIGLLRWVHREDPLRLADVRARLAAAAARAR